MCANPPHQNNLSGIVDLDIQTKMISFQVEYNTVLPDKAS